ncbi:MAG: cyclic nucleotide-binding domain-containing protein [Gammaproteobacteria bacterium]|nr:cyclic nucleotide-binding domain-containing protein [Gammaproteobacteria bacterium]
MPHQRSTEQFDINDVLCQNKFCESLTMREINTFLEFTEAVSFKKGEIIADIGEIGDALFFVIHGSTGLFHENQGKEVKIGDLEAGELMGSMSFFDDKPRSARIRARSDDTRLLRISKVMYNRLRVEHPYIAVLLLEQAIMSLDHLFRGVSIDIASFNQYMYGGIMR